MISSCASLYLKSSQEENAIQVTLQATWADAIGFILGNNKPCKEQRKEVMRALPKEGDKCTPPPLKIKVRNLANLDTKLVQLTTKDLPEIGWLYALIN